MTRLRLVVLTTFTMFAFAGNSVLCRLALKQTAIDAATFTSVRLLSAVLMLSLLMRLQAQPVLRHGNWRSALSLFVYAVTLSFAYRSINTGAGALILFGAVQMTMLTAGFMAGERMRVLQIAGFAAAISGLLILVLPGIETPSTLDGLLMLVSGASWGVYSMLGRGVPDPIASTAGNFTRAAPFTIIFSLCAFPWFHFDAYGATYAVISGALTSALGYVLWYQVLQHMRAMTASTIQLSVPILAAVGGVILVGEALTLNLLLASMLILGGIWLVLRFGKR
jgi:drug/metabolite transporter (DMT)-like permease